MSGRTSRRRALSFLTPKRKKRAFIEQLPPSARLLDVGCGNDSPEYVKSLRPDIHYTGIDIGDYNLSEAAKNKADRRILCSPEGFDSAIHDLGPDSFDAIISAHNLEHCNYPIQTLRAMCAVLAPKGQMYLGFPSEESVKMPSRKPKGTLNFYDDPTHRQVPVFQEVVTTLSECGLEILFASRRYRPGFGFAIGLICEPFVAPFGALAPFATTWALYGFESIIWATRRQGSSAS